MAEVSKTAGSVKNDKLAALQKTVDELTGDFHGLIERFPMSSLLLPCNKNCKRIILEALIKSAQEFWQVYNLYCNIIQHESGDIKEICWRRMAELAKTLTDWLDFWEIAPDKSAEKLLALGNIFKLAITFRGWTTVCQSISCLSVLYKFASKTAMSLDPTFEDCIWVLTTSHVEAVGTNPHERAVLKSILERDNSFDEWHRFLREAPSCVRVRMGQEFGLIIFRGMFKKARIFAQNLILWKETHVFFCYQLAWSGEVVHIHQAAEKKIVNKNTTFSQYREILPIVPSDFFEFRNNILKRIRELARTPCRS